MFRKLKRKFILTNLLTSTAVIVIAFTAIYLSALGAASHREFKPFGHADQAQMQNQALTPQQAEDANEPAMTTNEMSTFNAAMDERIAAERQESLKNLLISLVIVGISVEIIIALISFYLAEQSIKPVREAYNAQKEFVANASHEIKTPLAVIQANLEAADIKGNRWIDNIAKKTEDLTSLNNQLLALARSESITEDQSLKDVNLDKLVADVISSFEPKAKAKRINIQKEIVHKNDLSQKVNAKALEQILNIYIDNAIKYGKKSIKVSVEKNKILVSSDGDVISKDKLTHLFERFYQADKTSDGVGLGLAIAQSIAEKNRWKLYAEADQKSKLNIFAIELR